MVNEMVLEIETADGFDPSGVTDNYAESAEAIGENQWRVKFETPLHGLAMISQVGSRLPRSP